MSLPPGSCPTCGKQENLLRCQGCKVMFYCGRDHQVANRPSHKSACNSVKKAQKDMDDEERKLRAHPGDWMTPANIFDEGVGHFWGIHETRPYMRARRGLVEALRKIKTRSAVQSAFDHIMDMLRLCRGDNMGVRDLAPALFLRLNKDQECYDFLKWYATTGQEGDYDWGNMDLGFLGVKDAEAFEPVDVFVKEFADLGHTVSVTLIKIRMLCDLRSLQNSTVLGEKLPREIVDNVRGQLVSTIISGNKEVMDSDDQSGALQKLESQVTKLYKCVKKSNPYVWPALLRPGNHLRAPLSAYTHGSPEHMQLILQYVYDSWAETPGAIDIIREQTELDAGN